VKRSAPTPAEVTTRSALERLAARYELPPHAGSRFELLLDLMAQEPTSITSVRDRSDAVAVHVGDSLSALALEAVRSARHVVDLGSGAGFPGLVLAIALPRARVSLVESVTRKGRFLARAADALGLQNTTVVTDRAESWSAGRGRHDLATARAVAALPVLLEYAAPLLAREGALVAWKGRRLTSEETDARAAAEALAMSAPVAYAVEPTPRAAHRTLYVSTKVGSTPNRFPRRPGMARKRPLSAGGGGESSSPANL
jgi:16S rRNA (guanine527-N7)-methyltransferase